MLFTDLLRTTRYSYELYVIKLISAINRLLIAEKRYLIKNTYKVFLSAVSKKIKFSIMIFHMGMFVVK